MSLITRAMLVALHIGQWEGIVNDEVVGRKACKDFNATSDSGYFRKRLLDSPELVRIGKLRTKARQLLYSMTMPWTTKGIAILPAVSVESLMQGLAEIKTEWEDAVKAFKVRYADLINSARVSRGQMFRPSDYPSQRDIDSKFYWATDFFPIPDAADFRVTLSADAEKAVKEEMAEAMKSSLRTASEAVYDNVKKVLTNVVTQLSKDEGRIFDSLIGNVRNLVNSLPAMNSVLDDPNLDTLVDQMKTTLVQYSTESLRDDDKTRAQARAAADAILKRMQGRA